MKIVFDTTFLVELDRKNQNAIELAKHLALADSELWISTVTVSEIMTGVYLRKDKDFEKAFDNAQTVLSQFDWADVTPNIAIKTGEILAFLLSKGKPIQYQDTVIAATALDLNADYLVTENTKHFLKIPKLINKIHTLDELRHTLL